MTDDIGTDEEAAKRDPELRPTAPDDTRVPADSTPDEPETTPDAENESGLGPEGE